jgi:hypothetical protein
MAESEKNKVTMELNSHQLETIKSLFGHYNWDINIEAESFVSENGGNTQDKCTQTESMETETEDENPGFVIEQDQSQNECPYCFCKPCITNEQNSQLWWHANTEEPHLRNSGLRKEHYKRFWTMLLHRGVWNDDRYIVMKVDAMSRDPRRQRYDWHKRDIMPKCVVSLVRHWFPNPGGFPYMGHMWE